MGIVPLLFPLILYGLSYHRVKAHSRLPSFERGSRSQNLSKRSDLIIVFSNTILVKVEGSWGLSNYFTLIDRLLSKDFVES